MVQKFIHRLYWLAEIFRKKIKFFSDIGMGIGNLFTFPPKPDS